MVSHPLVDIPDSTGNDLSYKTSAPNTRRSTLRRVGLVHHGGMAVPSLFVIRGNDQGSRFELEQRRYRLGRDSSSTIQVHDTEVSRQHAQFVRSDQDYVISDHESSNGTFVNGKRITEHRLSSGDQVQVGSTLMLYTGPADDSTEDIRTIDIAATDKPETHPSRIVTSIPQEEGSQAFDQDSAFGHSPWIARARSNLQVMYRTALAISHTLDIDQLLQRIMELIFEWVEADRGCIMLVDAENKELMPKVRRTRAGVRSDEKITISRTILDYVTEQNEGVITSNAREDERWDKAASILQMGIREAICVPMQGRYDVVGVIYIDTFTAPNEIIQRGGTNKFTEDHLKLMVAIGHQAALAVEDTRYYSAMVEAERLAAIGQTVATLSHHIKNILQGIRGGSYLIEMGLSDHDDSIIGKGWDIVEKNQGKISALVMDMLTFSKEREPDLSTANVNQVIDDVIELMRVRATDFKVELVWQPAAQMPDLVFDPDGLHRAVLNVVTNAIDAADESEREGHVAVQSQYLGDKSLVQIAVEDNGEGIPKDQMDQLFSPFVSSKKGRGTGLGLPVSQKILNEHGGRIIVENTSEEGTRFVLELPAVMPETAPQTTTHETDN